MVARGVDDLQRTLTMLQKGGAQRVLTLLRLAEVKPEAPASGLGGARPRPRRVGRSRPAAYFLAASK